MTLVWILIGLNLIASVYCIIAVIRSSVVTWKRQDEAKDHVDESLAELLTYAINIDKVKEKAKEHPGEAVELEELL